MSRKIKYIEWNQSLLEAKSLKSIWRKEPNNRNNKLNKKKKTRRNCTNHEAYNPNKIKKKKPTKDGGMSYKDRDALL